MKSIGIIHTPYKKTTDIPIQGRFKDNVEAFVELKKNSLERHARDPLTPA